MSILKSLGLDRCLPKRFRGGILHAIFLLLLGLGLGMAILHLAKRVGLVREGYKGRKELMLLHMEGCPHCETLMPKWDAAASTNKTPVKMTKVERKDEPELVQKHGVSGFPTILLLNDKGDQLEKYEGARTTRGILDYCKKHAQI